MKVKDLINLFFGIKGFMLVDAWNGKVLYRSWSSSKKKLDELVDLEVLGINADTVLIKQHGGNEEKPVVEISVSIVYKTLPGKMDFKIENKEEE